MFNKILIGVTSFSITSLLGILTWISTEQVDNIKFIRNDVSVIKTQQTVTYEHLKNTDSRVGVLEAENKEHLKEFQDFKLEDREFKAEAKAWYRRNGYQTQ